MQYRNYLIYLLNYLPANSDRHTDRQKDRQTDRQTGRQTDRHDRQTDTTQTHATHTHTHTDTHTQTQTHTHKHLKYAEILGLKIFVTLPRSMLMSFIIPGTDELFFKDKVHKYHRSSALLNSSTSCE